MVFIKIYHTLGGQYFIHGKEFPKGTVVLQTDNGIELFCTNFNTARSREMLVIIYKEKDQLAVELHVRKWNKREHEDIIM